MPTPAAESVITAPSQAIEASQGRRPTHHHHPASCPPEEERAFSMVNDDQQFPPLSPSARTTSSRRSRRFTNDNGSESPTITDDDPHGVPFAAYFMRAATQSGQRPTTATTPVVVGTQSRSTDADTTIPTSTPSSGSASPRPQLLDHSDGVSDASSQDTAVSPAPLTPMDEKADLSSAAPDEQAVEDFPQQQPAILDSYLPNFPTSNEAPAIRHIPKHTSSFLRPGSKFVGTQQSDLQTYNVEVEIKYVDMTESFLCGYLRIEGLTPNHPTLTTYFEGEIIGTKHSFITRRPDWCSSEKTDLLHWNKFPEWRPLSLDARRPNFRFKNFADRECLFMRWKEHFLVPDHRVVDIVGASFEGFYYICFNQVAGKISGIYYHAKSAKFQQLELKHVDDRGCMGGIQFR